MTLQIGSGLEVIEGVAGATLPPSAAIANAVDTTDSVTKLNQLLATLRVRGVISASSTPPVASAALLFNVPANSQYISLLEDA